MQTSSCILIYSKFSDMCKKLLAGLESSPVNLQEKLGLKFLCIDNEDIRERILSDKRINLRLVPCLLNIFSNGVVEKYEGTDSFLWIEETVRKLLPPPPVISQLPVQQPNNFRERKQKYEQEFSESSSEEEFQNRKRQSRKQRKKQSRKHSKKQHSKNSKKHSKQQYRKQPKQKSSQNVSSIQDLQYNSNSQEFSENMEDSENSSENSDDNDIEFLNKNNEEIKRPPVGVRTGPNNYEFIEDFGGNQEMNRDASSKTKDTTQSVKTGNNLMAAALAMQKERESRESKNPRPNLLPEGTKRPV